MPISRSQMPRQMYGLGSFVKSIGKGIKKIVKSPIGKAAILGFGANALMPGGLSSLFSGGGGLASMFGKAVTNHASSIHGIRTHYNLMEYNDLEYIKNIQVIKDYLKEKFSSLIE